MPGSYEVIKNSVNSLIDSSKLTEVETILKTTAVVLHGAGWENRYIESLLADVYLLQVKGDEFDQRTNYILKRISDQVSKI